MNHSLVYCEVELELVDQWIPLTIKNNGFLCCFFFPLAVAAMVVAGRGGYSLSPSPYYISFLLTPPFSVCIWPNLRGAYGVDAFVFPASLLTR